MKTNPQKVGHDVPSAPLVNNRRNRREEILTSPLPQIALSIRQPWAWLIVNGYKDVENRETNIKNHCGPVLIHAPKFSQGDYDACLLFLAGDSRTRKAGLAILNQNSFLSGGIIGVAHFSGPFSLRSGSGFWTGPLFYKIRDARPLPFKPCKGRLGFFKVDYNKL